MHQTEHWGPSEWFVECNLLDGENKRKQMLYCNRIKLSINKVSLYVLMYSRNLNTDSVQFHDGVPTSKLRAIFVESQVWLAKRKYLFLTFLLLFVKLKMLSLNNASLVDILMCSKGWRKMCIVDLGKPHDEIGPSVVSRRRYYCRWKILQIPINIKFGC